MTEETDVIIKIDPSCRGGVSLKNVGADVLVRPLSGRSGDRPLHSVAEQHRLQDFLLDLEHSGRVPNTLQSYRYDWLKFARWFRDANGEPFDLRRLTALDVRDFKRFCLENGQTPSTVNRVLVFLKRYCSYAFDRGEVKGELLRAVKAIPYVKSQSLAPKSLGKREVRKLLREVELRANARDKAIIYILLYTGLRVGELVTLTLEDLELSPQKGTIRVRSTSAKGSKERKVPVPLEARRALEEYLLKHSHASSPKPQECRGGSPDPPDGLTRRSAPTLLFFGQRGPIKEDAVLRIVHKYGQWAGLALSPHLLRHTFAFNYLENNANDLVGLASILGHENLQSTSIYTRKRLEDLQTSVEKLKFY